MSKLLYINNSLIDLYPDTVIAQTLQAFEIGQLGSVRTNYTNRIRIPKTGNNRRALGFSDDSKSSTSFPYTSYSARYVENGIEIIRNGSVVLKETTESFLLTIFSGPVGFFDFIETKKLWDLDTTDINTGWSDTVREGRRNATTGMVAPLVDDGVITHDGVTPAIIHTGGSNKHPWIYYHTVIDKIFETAGYEKEGDIFSDDKYLKLALPLKTSLSPPFINAKGFHASALGTQVIVDPSSYTDIEFPTVSQQGSDEFYDGESIYLVSNADTSDAYFGMTFRAAITITVSGGTVDIILALNNFPTVDDNVGLNTHTAVGSGTYYINSQLLLPLEDNDAISVRVVKNTGTPTVTITNGTFEGYANKDLLSTYIYFNHLFEDINQIDFLRDFSVRFNVMMTERNGVIVCKTMDEVLEEAPIDWTEKRGSKSESLRYAYSGLAQNNYFTYGSDDLVENVSTDFGRGLFTIANENIVGSQDIYSSIFNITEMIMFDERIFVARIPAGADVDSLGIRLCYLRQNVSANEPDSNVIYLTTARSDYKVAYFVDARQTHSMHWQYFIDNYYTEFVARMQKAKALTRYYRLTDVDIHTFDQLKPIYDSGEIFIVTKINNYRSGQITEVELFKIN